MRRDLENERVAARIVRAAFIAAGLRYDGKPRKNLNYQIGAHPNRQYRHPTRTDSRRMNPLYMAFVCMHERCGPDYKFAHRYHDRGIAIDPRWAKDKWDDFADWALANGYRQGLELDRRDNDAGYSPENCRFITHAENTANKDQDHFLRVCKIAGRLKFKAVRRLDTGQVYESLTAAAQGIGTTVQNVWSALNRNVNRATKGVPLVYV